MNAPELLIPLGGFLVIVTTLGYFALKREDNGPRY